MEMLTYLAKVNLFLIVFYTCYWLLFRNHTFFIWNRVYLLASLIFSFLLPIVKFSEKYQAATPVTVYHLSPAPVLGVTTQIRESLINWPKVLLILYAIGAAVMFFQLFEAFRKLFITIKNAERFDADGYTIVLLSEQQSKSLPSGSFSFFKWLVVAKADYDHNPEIILRHEHVHIRQLHSLDIVIVESLKVIFWINPVIWLYKRSMQTVHEFLADQHVPDREHYATFLVAYAFQATQRTITNQFFNSSLLKTRIRMIYKNRSSRWVLGKYLVIVPVTLIAVFLTAARERIPQEPGPDMVSTIRINTAGIGGKLIHINGIVLDENGVRIPDVIVILAGTTKGVSTGKDGKFELKDIPVGGKLVITHVKFKAAELLIEEGKTFYGITLLNHVEVISANTPNSGETLVDFRAGEAQDNAYTVSERKPQFPGGQTAMVAWLKENMRYPERALQVNVEGIALVQFTVDTEGQIGDVVIIKGIGFGIDWEAVNLVKKMPKWEPAIQNGKPIAMTQAIEIKFDLEEGKLKTRQGLFLKVTQQESLLTMDDLGKRFNKFFSFSAIEDVPGPAKRDTGRVYYTNYRYTPYQIATPGFTTGKATSPSYKYQKP